MPSCWWILVVLYWYGYYYEIMPGIAAIGTLYCIGVCIKREAEYCSPRGVATPHRAAAPRPGLLVRCGIAGQGAAPIRACSAEIEILGEERYISTFQSFRAITAKFNCSATEQSIHTKER